MVSRFRHHRCRRLTVGECTDAAQGLDSMGAQAGAMTAQAAPKELTAVGVVAWAFFQ